jgi:hypothetical protein
VGCGYSAWFPLLFFDEKETKKQVRCSLCVIRASVDNPVTDAGGFTPLTFDSRDVVAWLPPHHVKKKILPSLTGLPPQITTDSRKFGEKQPEPRSRAHALINRLRLYWSPLRPNVRCRGDECARRSNRAERQPALPSTPCSDSRSPPLLRPSHRARDQKQQQLSSGIFLANPPALTHPGPCPTTKRRTPFLPQLRCATARGCVKVRAS